MSELPSLFDARPPGCDCQWFENQVCDACQGVDPENPTPDSDARALGVDPHSARVEESRFSPKVGPALFGAECSCGWFSEGLWSDPEAAEEEAANHETEARRNV